MKTENGQFMIQTSPNQVYNAGMKGAKGSVEEGGTRVPSFWRLPGRFSAGVDIEHLAAAIDVFPTLAELAGAKLPGGLALDGRSLLPLLADPKAAWADRYVFIHESNWGGEPSAQRDTGFAVRNERFRLVGSKELFDIKADRGQGRNVFAQHPEVATAMRAAYDAWWTEVQPALEENEQGSGGELPKKGKKR